MDDINYKSYWRVITELTGYDFSGYAKETLTNRLENFISYECIASADELREKLFYDKFAQEAILGKLLTTYTEMFRDPLFFQSLRQKVFPFLSLYSKIAIWHVGCSTGEEVYSLAILLDELDLLDRCEIYATDVNELNIKRAASGIFSLDMMKKSSTRYYRSGGRYNLSKYYTAYYDHIVFNKRLRDSIKFMNHDIVNEKSPSRFHLILCRNVFIYFSLALQNKALNSMINSTYNYGYFGIGSKESISNIENFKLTQIDTENRIYRKIM
jgi:chemotaxis protein methyltransferase CheR